MSLYPRPSTPTPTGRGKVLVVDDIDVNRELAREALEEEGSRWWSRRAASSA